MEVEGPSNVHVCNFEGVPSLLRYLLILDHQIIVAVELSLKFFLGNIQRHSLKHNGEVRSTAGVLIVLNGPLDLVELDANEDQEPDDDSDQS